MDDDGLTDEPQTIACTTIIDGGQVTFDFTGTFGFNQQAAGLPRWWGAGFRYNWGGGN